MDKQAKDKVVAEITELAGRSKAVVAAGFSKFTVEDETALRRNIRKATGRYCVVRNTLAKRALVGERWQSLHGSLTGNTALIFADKDVVGVMKTLVDFSKDRQNLTIKAGVFEGKAMTLADIKVLASMPPREVLIGRLLGILTQPMRGLVTVLSALPRSLAVVVKAVADKKAKEAPAAAAEAPAPAPAAPAAQA